MNSLRPVIHTTGIQPGWLDYNDHLNEAYYLLIFDQAAEILLDSLGLGEEVTRATGISWVVLENHITYNNEVTPGDSVDVRMQVLDYDPKRLHLYFEMHVKDGTGNPAATLEQMLMCVDLRKRRSTRFPGNVQAAIQSLFRSHADLQRPVNIGRTIGIRRGNQSKQLDLLAIFHYVVGGIMAFFSCFPFIHVFIGMAIVSGRFSETSGGSHPPPDTLGWLFVIMGSIFILVGWAVSICIIIAGRKLKQRKSRMFCMVVAGIECMFMPFGTVLGVFTLIALNKDPIKQMYSPSPD